MKRTVEIVLTTIGLVISVFSLGLFLYMIISFQNKPIIDEGIEHSINVHATYQFIMRLGWYFVVLSVIGAIIGIISIIWFKGNAKPKQASNLLIISSIIILLGSVGIGFIVFLPYCIAGNVGLYRTRQQ